MPGKITRRDFVRNAAQAGAVTGLGSFLGKLPAVSADEAKLSRDSVRFSPDIEPLVRLIEDTPREHSIEAVAGRIRQGTSYQQLLAALMLAGVRGIQPRPVGFKFHAVLVLNSAHMASLAASDRDRWLPLFWALDNFKSSQARNIQEGDWRMAPVQEAKLPAGHHAKQRFVEAMDQWNEDGADRAVTALVRTAGAGEIVELFWRYGARDFRDIGHKAIYVANSWRTLQAIGWRHAEPVMRSLAYALLEHEGASPAGRDAEPDRPWRDNLKRVQKIRPDWQVGQVRPEASADLLGNLRASSHAEASEEVVKLLNQGVDPRSIWDGLFMAAGELLMRQPGIIGLHCVTATNALHFGFQTSGNDETRRLLMLQAAAYLALFRKTMASRGKLRQDLRVDSLEKVTPPSGAHAVEELFAELGKDRLLGARKTIGLLDAGAVSPEDLIAAGRRLIFTKVNEAHDYKFSSAIMEDYFHATPAWRNRYLAMSMFYLRGGSDRDNPLVERTKAALS